MKPPHASLTRFAIALWLLSLLAPLRAGELKKPYFSATQPGAWAEYLLTSPDGSRSSFHYERQADDAGRAVIGMRCKILSGRGRNAESKLIYILPRSFNLDREGLSYGKFTEKMLIDSGDAAIPVDEKTLETIRQCSKDFGGAVTFETSEKIGRRLCDRYAYSVKAGGPNPTLETGKLWLDPSVPFAIVKQSAKVVGEDGSLQTEFDMLLRQTGLSQVVAAATPSLEEPTTPAAPLKIGLAEGFQTGRIGLDVEVVPGSSGRSLSLGLVNKTDAELTVAVPAGELQLEVDSPVKTLKVTVHTAASVVLPASDTVGPLIVDQRGPRGVTGGRCSLSVYEGTPLFSGSVTMGPLPK